MGKMKFTRRAGGEGGMSLVELLVAIVILGVGLVAVLNALPVIFKAAARAQSMTVSALLAEECMAKVKSSAVFPPTAEGWTAFDPPFEQYDWKRDVADPAVVTTSGSDMLRRVTTTIRYPSAGSTRELVFYSYIANYSAM